mmetsp:Transcript_118364/g.185891  ORF Transcript_118364/g.185891 Transcript_118364/m.185891 type:complete len:84 (+) Transcript_118364:354-605(+)
MRLSHESELSVHKWLLPAKALLACRQHGLQRAGGQKLPRGIYGCLLAQCFLGRLQGVQRPVVQTRDGHGLHFDCLARRGGARR